MSRIELHRMLPQVASSIWKPAGTSKWESGVEDSLRYTPIPELVPCIAAASHVHALCDFACKWSGSSASKAKADAVADFIQNKMFQEDTGFYHDVSPVLHSFFDDFWPLGCRAATKRQSDRKDN